MTFLFLHFRHHRWLYIALCFGFVAFIASRGESTNLRIAAAIDIFYLV